ncbi:hypothetical protein NDU88_001737 [Pleurodeles waltl]|uniref:Uncharacterized protein n=1 Tax=Pleurodeles waltl TaxID=8319 RepID=A0AAV7TIN2_PLEWA|nr:hypothetical protein NDU88_001737 [Pleurodeles waltl]
MELPAFRDHGKHHPGVTGAPGDADPTVGVLFFIRSSAGWELLDSPVGQHGERRAEAPAAVLNPAGHRIRVLSPGTVESPKTQGNS